MKPFVAVSLALAAVLLWAQVGASQPPDRSDDAPPRRNRDRDRPQPPPPPPPRGGDRDEDRPARPPMNPLMRALDTNGDGVLSDDEIENAARSLKRLDRNKDGKITADELGPPRGPRPEGGRDAEPDEPRDRPDARPRDGRDGRDGRDRPRLGRRIGRGVVELGRVLTPLARERLQLTPEQRRELQALERDVRDRLTKILTTEQRRQLEDMGPPGPDDPDRPGGPGDRRRPDNRRTPPDSPEPPRAPPPPR